MTDDYTPEDLLELIEDGYPSTIKDEETSRSFLSEAEKILARWKLIEG